MILPVVGVGRNKAAFGTTTGWSRSALFDASRRSRLCLIDFETLLATFGKMKTGKKVEIGNGRKLTPRAFLHTAGV
jgi:hypothetical protein